MSSHITKFYFAAPTEVKDAANAAAYEAGLTGAAEFLRIALAYLVEHKAMPPEFKGRRAIMPPGPSKKRAVDQEAAQ